LPIRVGNLGNVCVHLRLIFENFGWLFRLIK